MDSHQLMAGYSSQKKTVTFPNDSNLFIDNYFEPYNEALAYWGMRD